MQPEDVYELTGVADPRISPDGSRVAFHVWTIDRDANEYRGAIWVAKLDGSEEPRPFTTGEKRDGGQSWSPDGRWLAFVSNRGGDEKQQAQLYVIPAEGGEARKLTDLKESVEEIAWAPDSTRIAFTARVRDEAYDEEDERKRKPRRVTRLFYKLDSVGWTTDRRRHLHVVDLDGGEPRRLTDGDCEDGRPAWSPDGKRIVFSALRGERWDTDLVGRLYVVDADGGEPQQVTSAPGSFDEPVFSPDGSRIAYHFTPDDGTFPHHGQIGVMKADGTGATLLTSSLDRQCTPYPDTREPLWDGERIVFAIEDGGNVHVYSVAAEGSSAPELLIGGEQSISGYDARAGQLAYVASTHTTMRELYAGAEGRRLTDVGGSFTGGRELVEAERFTAVSKDGTEVDAWVVRPPASRRASATPCSSTCTAAPSRSTAPASSTSSRCTPARDTPCSSPTRAEAPATARRGDVRSAGRSTAPGPAGAPSTTRTCSASSTPRWRRSTSSTRNGSGSSAARTAAS